MRRYRRNVNEKTDMGWLVQNWALVFAGRSSGSICSDTEAMARKINAQQIEMNLARIGRKVINIKENYHD